MDLQENGVTYKGPASSCAFCVRVVGYENGLCFKIGTEIISDLLVTDTT